MRRDSNCRKLLFGMLVPPLIFKGATSLFFPSGWRDHSFCPTPPHRHLDPCPAKARGQGPTAWFSPLLYSEVSPIVLNGCTPRGTYKGAHPLSPNPSGTYSGVGSFETEPGEGEVLTSLWRNTALLRMNWKTSPYPNRYPPQIWLKKMEARAPLPTEKARILSWEPELWLKKMRFLVPAHS